MKTLIHGQTFLRDQTQATILRAWQNLNEHFADSDTSVLLMDNCSPGIDPRGMFPDWSTVNILHDDHVPMIVAKRTIARFQDSLGHPHYDGIAERAGPCRAWMRGIEMAIAAGFDRYVYYESDLLCRHDPKAIFAKMSRPVGTGCPVPLEAFDEVGVFYADVEYLWRSKFVERYNWKGPTRPMGEQRMMAILGDDREVVLYGNRDKRITLPEKFAEFYPEGADYLTHATPELLKHFLTVYGLGHCWDETPAPIGKPGRSTKLQERPSSVQPLAEPPQGIVGGMVISP